MLSKNFEINQGDILTNLDIVKKFPVGNSGGMRRSLKNNLLILVHHQINSIYQDRWHGDCLYYTGMGLKGDQDINFAQNKTLALSKTNGVNILLFEVRQPNQYRFMGEAILCGEPFYETQLDENNRTRKVVIFPLKIMGKP